MVEPTPETPRTDTSTTQSSGGLSTGAKALIGCLGCLGVIAVVTAVAVAAGGMALRTQVERFLGGVSEQQEASETLERIRQEHPFEVPQDGVVTEDQLERFVAVTDRAWEEMEPWAEDLSDLRQLQESAQEGRTQSARELLGGVQGISGFARARVQIAQALEAEEMSLGEYVWTGITLRRAAETEGEGDGRPVPEENRELVERYGDELPRFSDDQDEAGPGLVLAVATVWGMTDQSTWQALGLDTLQAQR